MVEVRRDFAQLTAFSQLPFSRRGWAGAVLSIVKALGKKTFTLTDLYAYKSKLHELYPANQHIEPKIRQQLQVLLKLGFLERSQRGTYCILNAINK